MLVEKVYAIGLETLEGTLGDFLDMYRAAIQTRLLPILDFESKFGGDHYLITHRSESLAHEFLIREWPIDFGGIEEGDTVLKGRPDQANTRLLIHRRPKPEAQAHASEAEGRYFEAAFSKFSLLHGFTPFDFELPDTVGDRIA
jgi:hypothetical protein